MGQTEFLGASERDLLRACGILRRSGVVAVPTETVYGLGAIARDEAAILKIFNAKERPLFDPLIVHVPARWKTLEDLAREGLIDASKMPEARRKQTQELMHAFWPGPLTLIFPRGPQVPDLVTSALDTVGIRMPDHELTQRLLEGLGEGLAAPSANRFGRVSPTAAAHVIAELDGRIDAVLDGGPCAVGVESTILLLDDSGARCLRPGGIPVRAIEDVLGCRVKIELASTTVPVSAPGMLADHYAPATPLRLFSREDLLAVLEGGAPFRRSAESRAFQDGSSNASPSGFKEKVAVLFLRERESEVLRYAAAPGVCAAKALSSDGDFEEVARNLFAALRELDASGADLIAAERCDETAGLGFAVGDRLRRAERKRRPDGGS